MGIVPQNIIDAAKAAHTKYGIPASVSIAQWAVESGWGKHMPPGSNNPFGMKTRYNRDDPYVSVKTREVIKGKSVYVIANFRKFDTIEDAFMAKGQLLSQAPVYAKAFAKLPDREAFILAFAPVYATDPNYANTLRSIIKSNNLVKYDQT